MEEYIQTKARITAPEETEGKQMQSLNNKYKHAILDNSETKELKNIKTSKITSNTEEITGNKIKKTTLS